MSWVQRLERVFAIDIETCPDCGGKLRVIACIEEPLLIMKILGHVQQREELVDPLARGSTLAPSTNDQPDLMFRGRSAHR